MDKKLPPLSSLKPFDLHHFTFTFFLRNSLQKGFWIGPTYPNPSPIYSTTLKGANKKAYMSLFRWKKGSKKNWAIPESSRNSGTERKCSFGVFWKGELNWSCANFNFLSYQYFFCKYRAYFFNIGVWKLPWKIFAILHQPNKIYLVWIQMRILASYRRDRFAYSFVSFIREYENLDNNHSQTSLKHNNS